MKTPTNPLRRNAAVLAAAAIIGSLGVGGVVSAQADTPATPNQDQGQVEQSDGDGEQNDATESEEGDGDGEQDDATESEEGEGDGETNDDASDTGPDANPNEPGHQDASDQG